jgi:hypothetical protein
MSRPTFRGSVAAAGRLCSSVEFVLVLVLVLVGSTSQHHQPLTASASVLCSKIRVGKRRSYHSNIFSPPKTLRCYSHAEHSRLSCRVLSGFSTADPRTAFGFSSEPERVKRVRW